MSQGVKCQKRVSELRVQETQLQSALDKGIGDQAALATCLRNVQATLKKLTDRTSET